MKVNNIVVHYLNKIEGHQQATVDISLNLLDIDEKSINLIEKLNNNYKKTGITYAIFDDDKDKIFPKEFREFAAGKNSFLLFSQNAIKNLREKVENISPAKGGFLVFSEYESNGRSYIGIYLIRDTIGILFIKDINKSAYTINPAEHLDLEKLSMACRIDIGKFHANDGKYLSFIKKRLDEISEYFINWVAVQERENNKIFTENFYDLMNAVKLPKDKNGVEVPLDVFRERIFDYVNTAPSKLININEVSRHFYNDETYLVNFAENNNFNIDTEFQPDLREMRRFVRVDLSSDGIQIRFSRGEINKKIRFENDNKKIVIIESEKFANDLRKVINGHDIG